MAVTVRELKHGDYFTWFDVFAAHASANGIELTDDNAVLAWSQLMDPGHLSRALIAEHEDGTVVGLAHYSPVPRMIDASRSLHIDDLFVLDAFREHGVATALLSDIRARAAAGRFTAVRLSAAESDADAVRFAESVGEKMPWTTYEISQ